LVEAQPQHERITKEPGDAATKRGAITSSTSPRDLPSHTIMSHTGAVAMIATP
jgi:hypothetical protein